MEIKLLYFDDCPSWKHALANLRSAFAEEKLDISINITKVNTDMEANDKKFLGSPSFQVDGKDLWPEVRQSYSMSCRIYRTKEGLRGWPTIDMLRQRLFELQKDKEQK